jgi:hypothetical protein
MGGPVIEKWAILQIAGLFSYSAAIWFRIQLFDDILHVTSNFFSD